MSTAVISNITSFSSDVTFSDGINTQTFLGAVDYKLDTTPIISSVTPPNGNVFGGYNITLTGSYLSLGTPAA